MSRAALALFLCLLACKNGEGLTRELGARCGNDVDCLQRCLPNPTWPGGFCTRACKVDGDCPAASGCVASVCLFSCFDDRDCAFIGDGWGCRELAAGELVCAPSTLPDAGVADAN